MVYHSRLQDRAASYNELSGLHSEQSETETQFAPFFQCFWLRMHAAEKLYRNLELDVRLNNKK
jgi:hypothetical protein